MVEMVSNIS